MQREGLGSDDRDFSGSHRIEAGVALQNHPHTRPRPRQVLAKPQTSSSLCAFEINARRETRLGNSCFPEMKMQSQTPEWERDRRNK